MTAPDPKLTDIQAWLQAVAPSAQLTADSRVVAAGDVFFAYPGDGADGRSYIANAVERGAAAVVYENADGFAWNGMHEIPHLGIGGLKHAAGEIASVYYDRPDARMYTIAITGTNGKTSCSQWLGKALSKHGEPTAVIGTLGVGLFKAGDPGILASTGYTTPDAILLQRTLADMRNSGACALAIEASSIGLEQGRMNGMHIDAALFTNFTRDHLDYHGDMAAYEAAKAMLFDWPGLRHAVINLDDDMGLRLVQRLKENSSSASIIGYTQLGRCVPGVSVLKATEIRTGNAGTVFHVQSDFGAGQIRTRLVGRFNVSNVLGIAAVLLARGLAWNTTVELIESLMPVPGRMQQLGGQDAPLVVIDYAHTPDALEKVLSTLRDVAQQRGGQLWCVFGCGGDRDPGKRPQMGAVSMAADHVIVTNDNPRSESTGTIIEQILKGLNTNMMHNPPQVIEDRAAAILWAIKHAARPDVVLLAGKGHEAYQEIKGRKLPFLDADHAALALAARATMKGVA